MKRYRIPIAVTLFLLPVLVRTVFFHQGIFWRAESVATPDYGSYRIPQPPLSTSAPAAEAASSRAIILLDQSHANMFSPSELETLTALLHTRGARVESVALGSYGYQERTLADQLKYASAYISVCPIAAYSTTELQLLQDFVRRGGRLLVLTDPTRSAVSYDYAGYGSATVMADVIAANSLLASYDIAFVDDYLYNMSVYEGNYRNVFFTDFSANPLTKDLTKVVLYASHSLKTGSGTVLIQSTRTTKSSQTDADGAYAVAAVDAGANVLAIGDLTFLQPPYNQVADNAVFIRHIADFLLEAPRIRDLKDFPFLFQREVAIVPMSDVLLTADLLGPIQALQQDLVGVGIGSAMAPGVMAGKDLILLATFSSPGIGDYLNPLGIRLPSLSSFPTARTYPQIEIPGFGSIPASGIGLILFSRGDARSTLILLAEDSSSLTELLGVIGPQGFSNCILQGNAAVCGLSEGYGDFGSSWWQPYGVESPETGLDSTAAPSPAG
ncbi:MAG: hypothetical protein JW748_15140 [Anaerolineales bacterium]|nr:hypothetical protein [Anaerolineales bacterium]